VRLDAFWFWAAHFVHFDGLAGAAAFNACAGIIAAEYENQGTRNYTEHQFLQHF
jgi:hypothetical protein